MLTVQLYHDQRCRHQTSKNISRIQTSDPMQVYHNQPAMPSPLQCEYIKASDTEISPVISRSSIAPISRSAMLMQAPVRLYPQPAIRRSSIAAISRSAMQMQLQCGYITTSDTTQPFNCGHITFSYADASSSAAISTTSDTTQFNCGHITFSYADASSSATISTTSDTSQFNCGHITFSYADASSSATISTTSDTSQFNCGHITFSYADASSSAAISRPTMPAPILCEYITASDPDSDPYEYVTAMQKQIALTLEQHRKAILMIYGCRKIPGIPD
ncbi:hypothetical protein J6590_099391 [Homalodisca vitripennis]|nr:hypothetical protein J6590_099391 [Homalodisca vitripennis]